MSEVELAFPQAVLGAEIVVDTLHGQETLEIPPGTRDGTRFQLKGKGIEQLNGFGKGDHVAVARLSVPHPRNLSDEELELLRELAQLGGSEVKEGRRVLDRVKDLFG